MIVAVRNTLRIIVCVIAFALPLHAWNPSGHMTVAYIAYQRLEPQIRKRVDSLLKLNPEYRRWIADAAPGQEGLVAFLNASIWPDCIKGDQCPGYTSDGPNGGNTPPADATADRNIGYADRLMHKYWHFINHPLATVVVPSQPLPAVNAVSEIQKMSAALASTSSDDIKSYDIAWLAHLVGDLHQPLHAVARFTKGHPAGDAGGNLIRFCNTPCESPNNLHAYWDNLMGERSDPAAIRNIATPLLSKPRPPGWNNTDVMEWSRESLNTARHAAYSPPIGADNDPQALSPRPNAAYDANAHQIARQQILLGGYRLANLINKNLK